MVSLPLQMRGFERCVYDLLLLRKRRFLCNFNRKNEVSEKVLRERMWFVGESWHKKECFWGNSDRRNFLREIWQKIRFEDILRERRFLREFWQKEFSEGNLTERWMFLRIFWERESSFWWNIDRKMYVFERILTERRMILKELSQTEGGFWWNSDRKKDVSAGNDEK